MHSLPSRPHPSARPVRETQGYSLTELLIALALGSLVVAAISSILVSEIRLGRTQLSTQQRRNDWTRFTYFLANEVGEGCQVRALANLPATAPSPDPNPLCPTPSSTTHTTDGCPATGTLLFTVVVPVATDTGEPSARNIHYYKTGSGSATEVYRCGPAILSSGRLDGSSSSAAARLLSGIPLSVASDANNVLITLTPSLAANLGGGNVAPFAVRTRAVVIP